jgi:pimeloyl-[acyl-carrier protein] methyl ester esterase
VNTGGKTPLLFLHGWAMTPAVWQPLLAALGTDAFDARVPALPGHVDDGSKTNMDADATLADWVETLAPVLPPKTTVIGWSLGAQLALELARTRPDRVERLILFAATPRFVATTDWPHGLDAATVTAFIEGYAGQPAATRRRFFALQTLGDAARRQLLPQIEAASIPHAGAGHSLPALAAGLKILADSDLRPGLAAIEQPVHLIHGDGDALMPLAAARWLAAALPRARLTVLENCGHAPLLSRPADCAALICADFCARQEACA